MAAAAGTAWMALVVDMQEDFFAHDRLRRRRAELTQRVNELVSLCRANGVAVVWVRQEFAPDLSDAMLEARRQGIRIVIAGTPGAALLHELDCRPADGSLIKKRYSAFFGTDLDQRLATAGSSRLIVAGINTHACIRTTVVDAYQRDLEVVLAKDCIDSHDAEHHEVSWRYLDGKLGLGMSNHEIGSLISGGKSR